MSNTARPIHPGVFIKINVIPKGLSVTSAAEKLGVTRPALSNLLNGKASLSQTMASRLEKVFGGKREELMALQREYDHSSDEEDATKLVVSTYAPTFLDIRARNIEDWAGTLDARAQLPALIRRLVLTTGATLSQSNFPAYDQSQRPGWDGFTECIAPNAWVPEGRSGWEFGCNSDPWAKATDDYSTRCKLPLSVREETTFVFVTPRDWLRKDEWVAKKRAEAKWKDVRAYDANDLEQWLENSPSAQIWLANLRNIHALECKTLIDCWDSWACVSKPAISPSIFESAISSKLDELKNWLNEAGSSPLIISAASKEEGLAFLAATVQSSSELEPLNQLAIFFKSSAAIDRLKGMTSPVVPVIYSGELEQKVLETFPNSKSLIIADKNLPPSGRTIEVGVPSYESFRKAIGEMNLDEGQYASEIRGCGRSPTILRRLFAKTPALRMPEWALKPDHKRWMVPFVLVGRWDWGNKADQDILSILIDEDAEVIEHRINELSNLVDAPLLKEGRLSGVASKLESLRAVAGVVRERDISAFLELAEYVLEEDDPSLDLEESERWAAAIHKKLREHSRAIRESICDTLILLAVHGPVLLDGRLNIALANQVAALVTNLLKNREPRVWQSQQADLPSYAEAAPEAFLGIVEDELTRPHPAFECLFEPAGNGPFGRCERTGMLWALEVLAWDPSRLGRAINALASLCMYPLEDNWGKNPAGSIRDILLSWYPQTKASLEQRIEVLEALCRRHPEVGWDFCFSQLGFGGSSTSGTYKPRWRDDASEQSVCTYGERDQFARKCLDLLLSRSDYDREKLERLIELLGSIPDEDSAHIERLVMQWLESSPLQSDVAALREHVRVSTMTHRARRRPSDSEYSFNGHELYAALEPSDLVQRYRWLFDRAWVECSREELVEDELDFDARDKLLASQRAEVLREILEERGSEGVLELCSFSEAPEMIGHLLGSKVMQTDELVELVVELLLRDQHESSKKIDRCISGVLFEFRGEPLPNFLKQIFHSLPELPNEKDHLSILKLAPSCRENWEMVKALGVAAERQYWQSLSVQLPRLDAEDLTYCVKQLLSVGRPGAAFQMPFVMFKQLSSELLHQVLLDLATKVSEETDRFKNIEGFRVVSALNVLNERGDLDVQKLVQLEFLYGRVIGNYDKYTFPNLSKEIASSPSSFFHLIALCFGREDRAVDDPSLNLPEGDERRRNAATLAHDALSNVKMIPGTQVDGSVDMEKLRGWVHDVREIAGKHDRLMVADSKIGELLRLSSPDVDGLWPNAKVREVIEEVHSRDLATGFLIAVRNARGSHFRPQPDNGSPEREIASKYRGYAERVIYQQPFVGRMLMSIAQSYESDAKIHENQGREQEIFPDY
ncbi:HigA family addiction module antitoxin [Thalassospira lucentensis]|uniref:HigA family addiction module antitoxin n=1 Tax=Thalassospira lucentensis TaxID=168935 RepID=UPI003D2BC603